VCTLHLPPVTDLWYLDITDRCRSKRQIYSREHRTVFSAPVRTIEVAEKDGATGLARTCCFCVLVCVENDHIPGAQNPSATLPRQHRNCACSQHTPITNPRNPRISPVCKRRERRQRWPQYNTCPPTSYTSSCTRDGLVAAVSTCAPHGLPRGLRTVDRRQL